MISHNVLYAQGAYASSRFRYEPARERVWKALCRYFELDIPPGVTLLELGSGYCHFINNVHAREKHAVDLFEGMVDFASPEVRAHIHSCVCLAEFPDSSMDVVFSSNLFEHLTRDDLLATLDEVRRILRPGGRLLILQPNFKYCAREYFDDYTHASVFTHVSLADLLVACGFVIKKVVPRLLPFSLKSRLPRWSWLLPLYLRSPFRPFAAQMYLVAEVIKP